MEPHNVELRTKLKETFKEWYDFANNEKDVNCCFLVIHMKKGILRINHGEAFYHFDFEARNGRVRQYRRFKNLIYVLCKTRYFFAI